MDTQPKVYSSEYLKIYDPVSSLLEKLEQKDVELSHLRELVFKLERIVQDGEAAKEVSANVVQLFSMLLENDVILQRGQAPAPKKEVVTKPEVRTSPPVPRKSSPTITRKISAGQSPTFSRKPSASPQVPTKISKSASFGAYDTRSDRNKKLPAYEKSMTVEDMPRSYSMDSGGDLSASLMEVVRSTSMEQMVGHIYHLAKYQAGCRFLQKRLEENVPEQTTLIYNEIFAHVNELMIDPYGQYLVPKLVQLCKEDERNAIIKAIAPKLCEIACHTYGIHGVQKIIAFANSEQLALLADGIRSEAFKMILDSRGNYFIQAWLKDVDAADSQFIYDAICAHFKEVAKHKVGCIILQQCIDKGTDKQVEQLEKLILQHAHELGNDSFGNYVLQHAIQRSSTFAGALITKYKGNIAHLCCQKYSSNVIESCLESNPSVAFKAIFEEISDQELQTLLQDNYANFVVQKALDVTPPEEHKKLVARILPFLHQSNPNLKRIQKKILQV